MFRVGQLIRFISELNPQATYARLAFFNFLRYFCDSNEEWTSTRARDFLRHALAHPYWHQHKTSLVEETYSLIEKFSRQYQLAFDGEELRDQLTLQVVMIESFADLSDVIYKFHTDNEEEDFRLIALPDSELLCVTLNKASGSIKVSHYDSACAVEDGGLVPLRPDLLAHYSPDVELDAGEVHLLKLSKHLLGRLHKKDGLWSGQYLRGYTLQPCGEFHVQNLAEQPPIYYPLKRMEQYFVDRSTDPFYINLIKGLEKALSHIQSQGAEPKRFETTLQRTESISDLVYPDDKYLKLLVKELRQSLQGRSTPLQAKGSSQNMAQNIPNRDRLRDIEL